MQGKVRGNEKVKIQVMLVRRIAKKRPVWMQWWRRRRSLL